LGPRPTSGATAELQDVNAWRSYEHNSRAVWRGWLSAIQLMGLNRPYDVRVARQKATGQQRKTGKQLKLMWKF